MEKTTRFMTSLQEGLEGTCKRKYEIDFAAISKESASTVASSSPVLGCGVSRQDELQDVDWEPTESGRNSSLLTVRVSLAHSRKFLHQIRLALSQRNRSHRVRHPADPDHSQLLIAWWKIDPSL